ncbi:MAG: hypothetical protein CMJ58_03690 [Planctomycetaceae bacterium]|nr:hypothetical protein [Planctomycetaceae bacterium]
MKAALKLVSYAGLALTIVPAVLLYHGRIDDALYRNLMVLGMLVWFGSAIFWIRPDHAES